MEKNLKQRLTKQHLELLSNNPAYAKGVSVNNSYLGIGDGELQLRFNLPYVDLIFIKDNEEEVVLKSVTDPTLEEINLTLNFFNEPLPQWEKPQPKVGEVWQSKLGIYVVIKEEYGNESRVVKGFIINSKIESYKNCRYAADTRQKQHRKLADTLDDYYKEKFSKERTVIDTIEEMNKEIFKPTTIDPKSQVQQPHQYSYKGLKVKGKIPHDRSVEDHDSIEAFKKLLAICEALNGMFKKEIYIFCPFLNRGKGILDTVKNNYTNQSPIYFTSKEAFEAFNSAPENVELFKTFLKIK